MRIWKCVTSPALALVLCSSGGLGTTNDRLAAMQTNMQTLSGEVQSDRQYLDTGSKTAQQMSDSMSRATTALQTAVDRTSGLNARADSIDSHLDKLDAHLGKISDSMGSVAQSVSQVPTALNQVNDTAKDLKKSVDESRGEIKRVADNMAVMVVYLAVGMKVGMEYMASHSSTAPAPAAAGTPPAPTVAEPAPAAPLTVEPPKDGATVDNSFLDETPKKKD